MGQLDFHYNYLADGDAASHTNGMMRFFAYNIIDSISFKSAQIWHRKAATAMSITLSLGLYSMNGSTLSIANSGSLTYTNAAFATSQILAFKNSSVAQNITPGTWYFGVLASLSSITRISFEGFSINPTNDFPGPFIGGIMTVSTAALPATYATSDLDLAGNEAVFTPKIILTA